MVPRTCDHQSSLGNHAVAMQIGLRRVDGDPVRVMPTRMPLEERLEVIIESDPAMLGQD